LFTLGTAVAVHNAIERHTRLEVDIKWPNDLLIDDKKVCGILAEIQAEVDLIRSLIIGVGLNVNHETFPAEIAGRATSLRLASGRMQSRLEILVEFLEQFEELYLDFERKGPHRIISAWTDLSSFANGRKIDINDGVRRIAGVTRGLNPLGALRVERDHGHIEDVYSGEVVGWE
jgi:BirA family biotin operon repressor/biotin-[acetyl-CoA-carboxylase] ligase